MSNKEIIETLLTSTWICLKGDSIKFKKAISDSVANACENEKLKNEIEQLKEELGDSVKSCEKCKLISECDIVVDYPEIKCCGLFKKAEQSLEGKVKE